MPLAGLLGVGLSRPPCGTPTSIRRGIGPRPVGGVRSWPTEVMAACDSLETMYETRLWIWKAPDPTTDILGVAAQDPYAALIS